tara:strand:+ start:6619 stop:7332 length:714 start_codon:yes stop_codon:yes gene_type:complete
MNDFLNKAPIELFFWPTSNGFKISIFLEEANYPYNVNYVNITTGEQFKPTFLKISPNNRMPAIIDPDGPDGEEISIFESGAILQYLGEKTGMFYPKEHRKRIEVDEWLFWQVGNLGPMGGQAHHFRNYSQKKIQYAIDRYTNEVNRLYGVLDKKLSDGREYIAEEYSIADMACIGWIRSPERKGQNLEDFPFLKGWFDRVINRPAVLKGIQLGEEKRHDLSKDLEAQKILFGQRSTK